VRKIDESIAEPQYGQGLLGGDHRGEIVGHLDSSARVAGSAIG
jgi:hypothetical protein